MAANQSPATSLPWGTSRIELDPTATPPLDRRATNTLWAGLTAAKPSLVAPNFKLTGRLTGPPLATRSGTVDSSSSS